MSPQQLHAKLCPLHERVKGASLFSNSNLPEHPLYGMIRSEMVKGSV
jgi:hypothetical protein